MRLEDVRLPLGAPDLFGNDAAEDESDEVFRAYVLERPEASDFLNPGNAICVARAYKGEGKSALLRLTEARLRDQDEASFVISVSAPQIAPPESIAADYPAWVRAWKAALFGLLAAELGTRIGVAWSDDAMSLVEEAERSGRRQRSFLGRIIERLPLNGVGVTGLDINIAKGIGAGTTSAEQVLKRWVEDRPPIFMLVDDVDQNFDRSTAGKARVAAFFDACRQVVRLVPEVRMRLAVRPNVWTALKLEYESLSHVEQYCRDLVWSEEDALSLVAKRIEGFMVRHGLMAEVDGELPQKDAARAKRLVEVVFGLPMTWGKTTRPPHVLLYTLSKHRPRWLVELSRRAALNAAGRGRVTVDKDAIMAELEDFGRRRIVDLAAEFRPQCTQIEELITCFNRAPEEMATDELLQLIRNRVLTHLRPSISGVNGVPDATDVAAFLFEVGFFFARRDYADGSYAHFTYAERPLLLRSRSDLDAGMRWEIHPIFRQALEIRDSSGRERDGTRSSPN